MSKQRPYRSFEEAYLEQTLIKNPEEFDEFVLELIKFNILADTDPNFYEMRLPYIFSDAEFVKIYWYCLCRLFGEVYTEYQGALNWSNYIPKENLEMALEYTIEIIRIIFPPSWDFSKNQILTFKDIDFK